MRIAKTIFAVILTITMIPSVTLSIEEDNLLVNSLSVSGAKPEVFDIADWSLINREFVNFTQMEQYSDKVLEVFEAKEENFTYTKDYNKMYRILNMEGELCSDIFLQIIIQSVLLPEEYEKDPQTYLVVAVHGKKMENFSEYVKKVSKSIISLNGESKITSCVTGTFDGKLDEGKQSQILENICGYLNISDTEKMKDDYTFNIMAFSPLLSKGVQILDKNYNINIAIRYDSEEDKTYLWIGTPVISLE